MSGKTKKRNLLQQLVKRIGTNVDLQRWVSSMMNELPKDNKELFNNFQPKDNNRHEFNLVGEFKGITLIIGWSNNEDTQILQFVYVV